MFSALRPSGTDKRALSLIRSLGRIHPECLKRYTNFLILPMLWYTIMVLNLISQLLTKNSCYMACLLQRRLSKSIYLGYPDRDSNFLQIDLTMLQQALDSELSSNMKVMRCGSNVWRTIHKLGKRWRSTTDKM